MDFSWLVSFPFSEADSLSGEFSDTARVTIQISSDDIHVSRSTASNIFFHFFFNYLLTYLRDSAKILRSRKRNAA